MQSRFRTGFRGLFQAAAIGCLLVLAFTGTFAANSVPGFDAKPAARASDPGLEKTIPHPITYPRSTYQWPYSTGPSYGEVDSSQWTNAGVLHTQVGSFDLTRGLPAFPAELRTTNRLGKVPIQYFVLQLQQEAYTDGTFDRIREALTSAGGAVVDNMSVASHIVRLNAAAYDAVRGQGGILALEPYHPAFKLNPLIGRAPLLDPVKALSDVYTLDVLIFHGENPAPVAEAIKALGGNVKGISTDALEVEIHRAKLAQLAALEPVRQIFEHLPMLPLGQESSATVQVGTSATNLPYNGVGGPSIDGGGLHCYSGGTTCGANEPATPHTQILMVLDQGAQLDDGDLSDTRTNAGTAGAAHRKVLSYLTTNAWGGSGDLLGCDANLSGGFTHGHTAAAVALGNATKVATAYGAGWKLTDGQNPWDFDGVAYRAKLVFYDAHVTPATGSCEDPGQSGVASGDISGSLPDGYSKGARVTNFSWGSQNNQVYGTNSQRIDTFLLNNKDAMVFVSAGNWADDTNSDGVPDENSVSDPAFTKNGIVVGASLSNPGQQSRAGFSSIGQTASTIRVKPLLMAPGADGGGGIGLLSDYNCRGNPATGTADNDQANPVDCAIGQGNSGTSFSSPAAAGAALLLRDWFVRGYYPDGDLANNVGGDSVPNVSGALVKAMLVGSTVFMDRGSEPAPGGSVTVKYRFNREQGYGRIQMDKVLPLVGHTPAAEGLIVADGGIAGGVNSTTLSGTANTGVTETYSLNVCDNVQELRVALAWVEDLNDALLKNLNLELVSPTGKVYYGNYFTDDNNRNAVLDAGENCDYTTVPWPQNSTNIVDQSPWSLPTCANSARDTANPTEAIFLSPDPAKNGVADDPATTGINEGSDNMLEIGFWTVKVIGATPWTGGGQPYALAMSGPVCIGSSVSIFKVAPATGQLGTGSFVCNDKARIRISEVNESSDPTPITPAEISARTLVRVVDKGPDGVFDTSDDVLVDQESGISFTQEGSSNFFNGADITLTDGTAQQIGNGAVDVRDGQRVVAIYRDKTNGSFDPAKERRTAAVVDCKTQISFGGIVWGMFGQNSFTLVNGGCEKDSRNLFTFGFPDQYMDAGELIGYRFAFQSAEDIPLTDVVVNLKAVEVDSDSPRTCKPQTTDCADPNRLNNPTSSNLTILDPTKVVGLVNARAAIAVNFSIQVAASVVGTPEIEMVLSLSAKKSGKGGVSYAVQRHRLDVDEVSFFYSTDFPTGGTENADWNNNEAIETVTTDPKSFLDDYVFESRTYSSLTLNGRNNPATLQSPWNFDTNNGGFKSGLTNGSLASLNLTQWGEDRNLNGVLDTGEDRNANGTLDQNWNTLGGCGWQTSSAAGSPGGVWHTGRIDVTTLSTCLAAGTAAGRCRQNATVSGFFGQNVWWEVLTTPQFFKVHVCPTGTETDCVRNGVPEADRDMASPGFQDPLYKVEFLAWDWNQSMDLGDTVTGITWEMDTDPFQTSNRVDFINDGFILNALFGTHGAVSGGNQPLTDGYQLFANKSKCQDTNNDGTPDHCGTAAGTACTDDSVCTGNNLNGVTGPNRRGSDNCFFEGKDGTGAVKSKLPYGLAKPADDDVRNGYCPRTDSLNGIDKSKMCTVDANCTNYGPPYTTPCTFDGGTTVDQFVTVNGPIRNMDMEKVNGPDMRFSTFEDIYGDSGQNFQGAVGFYTQEGTPSGQPFPSFGLAVDDMVVKWREFKLDKDTTNCGTGTDTQCANVELATTNFYEGNSLVTITVTDKYPYDPVNNKNDCNNDGDYLDAGDDQDCNDNGIRDVLAKVISDQETAGEIVVLDEISAGSFTFRANLPISASFDAAGVLFIARSGTDAPVVRVQYTDRAANAAGEICKNNSDLALQGLVEASTSVFVNAGRISLKAFRQTDNGDNDGWADTNETVNLWLTFTNKSGVDADDLVVSINAADANTKSRIDCISQPTAKLPALANRASAETLTPFVFHVASTTNRVGLNDDFKARFNVTIRSNRFDVLTRTMAFAIELDLSASGGGSQTGYNEDFEQTKLSATTFTSMSLDLNKSTSTNSNGYRCQYNDPLGPNSNGPNRSTCFLGFTNAASNAYDWHLHTGGASDNNISRAYTGTTSLHWGVHPTTGAKRDTERFSQLDAIRTTNPINLPFGSGASPELTFKHQVSIMDSRGTNTPAGEAADRAVVAIQLSDSSGIGFGSWNKIFAYENEYDAQGTDQFSNCTFDPIDDGNDEDSFFNPSDPLRRLGPSSTCKPEFVFSWGGDTDYRNVPGKLDIIGRAFDGPGLKGSVDRGTWVQPKFSLNEFKGRRLRLRFLATSIEVNPAVTYNDTNIGSDNNTFDDGWYIDTVSVPTALATPATLSVDANANGALPGCTACGSVVAGLSSNLPGNTSGAPGQPLILTATATIDRCNNGVAQYQFWDDKNGNGVVGDAGDVLLRDWTDNPKFSDAPNSDTRYAVIVRCSSDPACSNLPLTSVPTAVVPVTVTCPIAGSPVIGLVGTIGFNSKTQIGLTTSQAFDAVRGDLLLLHNNGGNFTPTVLACAANNVVGSVLPATETPSIGGGFYWLLRPVPFCNQTDSYSTGGDPKEVAGRDAEIGASLAACP